MSDEGMGGDMLERYARGEASVPIPTFTRDVYRHLLARLDAAERERDTETANFLAMRDKRDAANERVLQAERERDALREALKGMVRGCDYSHFNDVELAAEAERYPSDWIDLITDARAALTATHSAPVVEE